MQQQSSHGPLIRVLLKIVEWFDNEAVKPQTANPAQDRLVDWLRMLPFIGVHLMCLGVFVVGWSWAAITVCVIMYAVRMFAITGFYHRYFSHRAFKTSRAAQFVFAVIGNSSAQKGPLWWAAHHRHHHRHSDTEDDVHSPHENSFIWSHMLWITSRANASTQLSRVGDLAKYPELRFLDRFDVLVPVATGFLIFCLGVGLNYFFPSLGTNGIQMLIWGFFVSTVLLFHGTFTINSLSHKFGTQRFKTTDHSKNNFWLALITFGEGWHNNHHYYPASARQGFFWYEVDLTYYILKLMAWMGIIWDLKPVPSYIKEKGSNQES